MTKQRRAGVLMPIFSLPGTIGIGDFGMSAYDFVDSLKSSGSTLWQILPLNPVGYGNSPYQTYSAFAGDEIYISIENLYESMDLKLDLEFVINRSVDYDQVRSVKQTYLKQAFDFFKKDEAYEIFVRDAFWLEEYVQFITMKKNNGLNSWLDWDLFETTEHDLEYERFIQYIFYIQWMKLKTYANKNDVLVVGDIPIYLGHDSAEVYFHRDQFYLDKKGKPTVVAGVPADFFSLEGQLWGNPLYRWDAMKTDGYQFWVDRLKWNQKLFDVIRIDHFRAFDTYWEIPGDAISATEGVWKIGPRNDFFDAMYKAMPDLNLVVEDLGDLRPEVLELRDDYDLMGMKIIQFSLNSWEIIKDEALECNLLAYTGTHDNETVQGMLMGMTRNQRYRLKKNLERMGMSDKKLYQKINHYTLSLPCNWAIIPSQDLMGLDNSARINTPATIGSPNWEWKVDSMNSLYRPMREFKKMITETERLGNITRIQQNVIKKTKIDESSTVDKEAVEKKI